jgi:hypothetical protein
VSNRHDACQKKRPAEAALLFHSEGELEEPMLAVAEASVLRPSARRLGDKGVRRGASQPAPRPPPLGSPAKRGRAFNGRAVGPSPITMPRPHKLPWWTNI